MNGTKLNNFKQQYPYYQNFDDSTILNAIRSKYSYYQKFDDNVLIESLEKKYTPKEQLPEQSQNTFDQATLRKFLEEKHYQPTGAREQWSIPSGEAGIREQKPLFEIPGMNVLGQAAYGYLSEATAGLLPAAMGKDVRKQMEAKTPTEKVARGAGSLVGFVTGAPLKLAKKVISKVLPKVTSPALKMVTELGLASAISGNEEIAEVIQHPSSQNLTNFVADKLLSTGMGAVTGGRFAAAGKLPKYWQRAAANVIVGNLLNYDISKLTTGKAPDLTDVAFNTLMDLWFSKDYIPSKADLDNVRKTAKKLNQDLARNKELQNYFELRKQGASIKEGIAKLSKAESWINTKSWEDRKKEFDINLRKTAIEEQLAARDKEYAEIERLSKEVLSHKQVELERLRQSPAGRDLLREKLLREEIQSLINDINKNAAQYRQEKMKLKQAIKTEKLTEKPIEKPVVEIEPSKVKQPKPIKKDMGVDIYFEKDKYLVIDASQLGTGDNTFHVVKKGYGAIKKFEDINEAIKFAEEKASKPEEIRQPLEVKEEITKVETPKEAIAEIIEGKRESNIGTAEFKKLMIAELDRAIEKAPSAGLSEYELSRYLKGKDARKLGKETITIEIPRDGEFKIVNVKEELERVKAKVKRLSLEKAIKKTKLTVEQQIETIQKEVQQKDLERVKGEEKLNEKKGGKTEVLTEKAKKLKLTKPEVKEVEFRYDFLTKEENELLDSYRKNPTIENKPLVKEIYNKIDIIKKIENKKYNNGQKVTDFINDKIAQGFFRLEQKQQGAVKKWILIKNEDNYYSLNGDEANYARLILENKLKPEIKMQKGKTETGEKKPWEMTREEFVNKTGREYYERDKKDVVAVVKRGLLQPTAKVELAKLGGEEKGYEIEVDENRGYAEKKRYKITHVVRGDANGLSFEQYMDKYKKDFSILHKNNVEFNLSEGKPVPAEVLKDYPELVGRANERRIELRKEYAKKVASGEIKQQVSETEQKLQTIEFYDKNQQTRTGKLIKTKPNGDVIVEYQGKQIAVKAENVKQSKKTLEQVTNELSKKIEKEEPPEDIPVGLSIKIVETQPTKSNTPFENKNIEIEYQQSKGIKKVPLLLRASDKLTTFWHKLSRGAFEYLPRTAKFSILRNELQKLAKQKEVTSDKTIRLLNGIIVKLKKNKDNYDIFERTVLLNDLIEEVNAKRLLPGEWTPDEVIKEYTKFNSLANKNPDIKESLSDRKRLWDTIITEYIDTMENIGFHVKDRFTKEDYFRHQILEYANARGLTGTGKRLKTPVGRSFLKKRQGSELSINTNYLEAEYEVMSQMLYDIERAKVIKAVDKNYNIINKLKIEAKKQNKDWEELIPNDYGLWQPREGNVLFFTHTIPERIAQELLTDIAKEVNISAKDINKILAIGGQRENYVLPKEVINQLNNLVTDTKTGYINKSLTWSMIKWKIWTLISPRRFAKYNIRNISGDAEAVFIGNSSAFKKVPQAIKELRELFYGKKQPTGNLKDWYEKGGVQQLLQIQEIGEIKEVDPFINLFNKKTDLNIIKRYFKVAAKATNFRETILRYANYLDYLEQMAKNRGIPKNYGVSIKEEVMALPDIKDRAFKLQNDLLGAYDDISIIGQELRSKFFPFWSWKELNFRRYIRLIKNAATNDKLAYSIGKTAMMGLRTTPFLALRTGKFLIKATGFWTMLQVYNNLFYKKEEKQLPQSIKRKPHIILGKDEKGNIQYFSRLGVLGDFLEFFGLEEAPYTLTDWLNGKKSLREIAKDMAKAPINVFVQGLRPEVKLPVEIATQKSLYPDLFKPSLIRDQGLHIARSLGLENEYKAIKNLPSKGYEKSLKLLTMYEIDPYQAAYMDIYNEKDRYLKNLKKDTVGSYFSYSPKSNALYNFKLALKYEDKEAAIKYFNEYIKFGGTKKGMAQSITMMNPLYGIKDENDFINSLDAELKTKLKLAINFYDNVLKKEANIYKEKLK